jgi:hypothetical protein
VALEFVGISRRVRGGNGWGVSSLSIRPDTLGVVGVLPHGCDIAPRNEQNARTLIAWLESWIERNPDVCDDCGQSGKHDCPDEVRD